MPTPPPDGPVEVTVTERVDPQAAAELQQILLRLLVKAIADAKRLP
jgi:hypothetical protein